MATDARRARAVKQLLSTAAFAEPLSLDSGAVERMCHYVFIRRLNEGPLPAWEQVDIQLQQIYQRPLAEAPSLAEVQEVVGMICTRDWGENGSHLRVRSSSHAYVCSDFFPRALD